MYIKSIQLDGFKSYQKHTEITGFSDKFNAITGYNGSGKSNVLDSICFILGISKLDNIRAKSMAELISHGGTKATVQIRFDNTDKPHSPYGMEHLDEIVVQRTITAQAAGRGCATNYTLNGHAATNGKIIDFFRSIGLNVNNPHFLIMQGRITTVLNMKPEEILGMVEEAAGTKMYDQKKKETEKVMYLKMAKIKEIDEIFKMSIDPRMEKFREDRKNLVELQRVKKLKENAERKYEAFTYYTCIENAKKDKDSMEKVAEEIQELDNKIERIKSEIERKEEEKKKLEEDRPDKEAEEELQKIQKEKMTEKLKLEQEKSTITDGIARLVKDQERISKGLTKDRKGLESKLKEKEQTEQKNEQDLNQYKDDEGQLEKYRNDLEALTRGTVANDQGQHVSIEHEIQECRGKAATLEANIKTATNRKQRLVPRINQIEREHAEIAKKSTREVKELQDVMKEKDAIVERINRHGFDAQGYEQLKGRVHQLNENLREIDMKKDDVTSVLHGYYKLKYTPPPVGDFNERRDISGIIAHMVFLKEGRDEYAHAVEIAMGGYFQHVVVRNQETARQLIDAKSFTSRKTLVPISENDRAARNATTLGDIEYQLAEQIAEQHNETVVKLIDMVEFPEFISNTIVTALSGIMCVTSMQCARQIAYHPRIRKRVVTLSGDDIRVNGGMSGGYSDRSAGSPLLLLKPMKQLRDEELRTLDELEPLQAQLRTLEQDAKQAAELRAAQIEVERRLSQLKANMKNSTLGVIQNELDNNKAELTTVCEMIETNTKLFNELNERVKTLEMMKNNDTNSKEKRKKELQAQISKAEQKLALNKDKAEKAKRAVMQISATVDDLKQSIENDEAELKAKQTEQQALVDKLPAAEQALAEAEAEQAAAAQNLEDLKTRQRQRTSHMHKATKDIDLMKREENKTRAKKEEREKESTRLYEQEKGYQKHAAAALKKYEWLADEQVHFNKKGGLYDFDGYSTGKGQAEIKEFNDKTEKLERNLCMKNVSNLDTCEAKVIDIKNKRDKLTEDFDMLRKTIAQLDKKKVDELNRAHKSVNDDFDKIFHCLLPDAHAKLVPPEGKDVCDGLDVKVSFNGVEKDSLAELSGGQRSLVALSLILAMLKFKPAPLYILDEVDAALDLSHTANIGLMIKSHFQTSQFIIVSLKQGMFSNADVLFQTNFADGHSSCTRLTGAALEKAKNDKKLAKQADEITASEQVAKKKKKTAAAAADEDAEQA